MPKRLDVYLSDNNIVKSRSLAATLIKQGSVEVNGRICSKPSFTVNDDDTVKIIGELPKYVGRGASTGGFTDCMLKNGAEKVYSVDVGTDQLDEKLRNDSRVISMEKTDIRNCVGILPQVDFISIDVSFISLKLVLPTAFALLKDGGECVALIKPQFEAGKAHLSKNGIVRDIKVQKKVCEEIAEFVTTLGFEHGEVIASPIAGGDGNSEYLIFLKRPKAGDRL